MSKNKILGVLALVVLTLAGCGLKGPLYMPTANQDKQPVLADPE